MKKLFAVLLVGFCVLTMCFAKNVEKKRFFDLKKGYDGYASSKYIGNMADFGFTSETDDPFDAFVALRNMLNSEFTSVDDISDSQRWILDKVWTMCNQKIGEFYLILITDYQNSDYGLAIVTCSTYDGDAWIGYEVDSYEMEEIRSMF